MFEVNDVVQFNENYEWCGSLGIITEVKQCNENIVKYMIGVPIPMRGTTYIFVMNEENSIDYIGKAVMIERRKR